MARFLRVNWLFVIIWYVAAGCIYRESGKAPFSSITILLAGVFLGADADIPGEVQPGGESSGENSSGDAPSVTTAFPTIGALIQPTSEISAEFSQTMDIRTTPAPVYEWSDGSAYLTWTPVGASTFWATARKLVVDSGLRQLPENTDIRIRLPAVNITNAAGIPLEADVVFEFRTGVAPAAPVTDTMQRSCWYGGLVACHLTRQDGWIINVPLPRTFDGPKTNPGFPNDLITVSVSRNLTWTSCLIGTTHLGWACLSSGDAIQVNFYEALDACSQLNTMHGGLGFAGISSWRLPSADDLGGGLVNYDLINPAGENGLFGVATVGDLRSSTTDASANNLAWSLTNGNGFLHRSQPKGARLYARCLSN